MKLEDLGFLAKQVEQKIANYNFEEFSLNEKFKEEFTVLLNENSNDQIVFKTYSAIVTTTKGLKIILPNQWFTIASFFYEFLNSLFEYKRRVMTLNLSEDTIKGIRGNTIDQNLRNIIIQKFPEDGDLENIEKFLTNYGWWYGSKTIDRGDFFVSSVLSIAKVVNVSHSYIADLAYYFSLNQKLVEFINSSIENSTPDPESDDVKTILINKKLRSIIFESFKYCISVFGENKVIFDYAIKDTKIEDRNYQGLSLNNYFGFETLIGLFETEQTLENLSSSGTPRFLEEKINILGNENSYFTSQWNGVDNGRGLSLENFNKLLSYVSAGLLEIVKQDGVYKLIEKTISNGVSPLVKTHNTIYYGSPGTGKSHKVNEILQTLNNKFYERVTFHPEYDNTSFIGGYKPVSAIDSSDNDIIKYKFVPQSFSNIYKRAWQDLDNQYYLVIEEINRGNCAEIFGEIFQLLDRNSNYTVSPSKELKEYLENDVFKNVNHAGIKNGLQLPPNLSILATMNTSDQSLFPMDSAFKRRWEWEYIPICYNPNDDFGKPNDSFDFEIDIEDGQKYSWIKFIEKINLNHIKNNPSLGMDKCIGNYFIKPDEDKTISLKPFINKVMFYLWNDVFKDEDNKVFEDNTSYEDFFPVNTNGKKKIKELFERIELKPKAEFKVLEDDSQLGMVAEEIEKMES